MTSFWFDPVRKNQIIQGAILSQFVAAGFLTRRPHSGTYYGLNKLWINVPAESIHYIIEPWRGSILSRFSCRWEAIDFGFPTTPQLAKSVRYWPRSRPYLSGITKRSGLSHDLTKIIRQDKNSHRCIILGRGAFRGRITSLYSGLLIFHTMSFLEVGQHLSVWVAGSDVGNRRLSAFQRRHLFFKLIRIDKPNL